MGTFFISLWNTLASDFDWREVFSDLFPRNLDWNLGISFNEFGCLAVFLCRFTSKEFIGIGSAVLFLWFVSKKCWDLDWYFFDC